MKLKENYGGSYELSAVAWKLSFLSFLASLLTLSLVVHCIRTGFSVWDSLIAFALTCSATFLFYENSLFVIEPNHQRITWRKQTFFRKRSGTISFSSIKNISLERSIGTSRASKTNRLVICTEHESTPILDAYSSFSQNIKEEMCRKLTEIVTT